MTSIGRSPAARKASLRLAALTARDRTAMAPGAAAAAAEAVARQALANPTLARVLEAGSVAGYWPIRSELDPRPLMRALAARGVDLALPVTTGTGLVFRRWREGDVLVNAGFGTLGPPPDSAAAAPDILLVPLAAVDRAGNRLGYGQGHYDAAIARLSAAAATGPIPFRRPFTIGLAYDVQVIDAVPAEPHDRRLDAIVTPMQSILIDTATASG